MVHVMSSTCKNLDGGRGESCRHQRTQSKDGLPTGRTAYESTTCSTANKHVVSFGESVRFMSAKSRTHGSPGSDDKLRDRVWIKPISRIGERLIAS